MIRSLKEGFSGIGRRRTILLGLAVLCLLAPLQLATIRRVPFHPDETSLLYQSRDLEGYLRSPLSLAYQPGEELSREQSYRALNAPLSKYVLGLGRRLAGYGPEAVAVDWDWSETWEHNLAAAAHPPDGLLFAARMASAVMVLAGGALLTIVGFRVGGSRTGWLVFLLYGTNALVLLHGRRAMAEGSLLFAVSLAMLTLVSAHRRPAGAGLAAALAASAKHSAIPIAVVGLLAAGGFSQDPAKKLVDRVRPLVVYAAGFCLTILALNPFLWRHPVGGLFHIIDSRGSFVAEQVRLTEAISPERLLRTPSERAASLLGHLFVGPLQFQEVGNYADAIQPAIDSYRSFPLHRVLRGPIGGGLLLMLLLLGGVALMRGWRPLKGESRPAAWWLAGATLMQTVGLWQFNPLPFQRYYIPLLPFALLWQALGAASLIELTERVLDRS